MTVKWPTTLKPVRQPTKFGDYILLDLISVGGMAEVFHAKSSGPEGFQKIIAIKRILPSLEEDRDFIKMFIDEAKIAGQLSHANIAQIFELGMHEQAHFIAMEYIWGKDLLQIQRRFQKLGRRMPAQMACYVLSKICEGLHYAHTKTDESGAPLEIVHRDCSPQNILVSYDGEVKVIDFGIARAARRSSRTNAGVLKGKFGYMSPEQVRGMPLDHRSDVFALGTVLWECLTGARLFVGESDFSTLESVRDAVIPAPSGVEATVPKPVEDIVFRALAREPKDRYQTCAELNTDLRRFLSQDERFYTGGQLAGWLKQAFSEEIEHERKRLENYKNLPSEMVGDGAVANDDFDDDGLPTVEFGNEPITSEEPPERHDATLIESVPSLRDIAASKSSPAESPFGAPRTFGAGSASMPPLIPDEVSTAESQLPKLDSLDDSDEGSTEERLVGNGAKQPSRIPLAASDRPTVSRESPRSALGGGLNALLSEHEKLDTLESPLDGITPIPTSYDLPTPMPALPHGIEMLGTEPGAPLRKEDSEAEIPMSAPVRAAPLPLPLHEPPAKFPKRTFLGVGLAVLLCSACGVGAFAALSALKSTPSNSAMDTGTLAVVIHGSKSALVFVDGEETERIEGQGHTALELSPGRYALEIRSGEHAPCHRQVDVSAAKIAWASCEFSQEEGTRLKASDLPVTPEPATKVLAPLKDPPANDPPTKEPVAPPVAETKQPVEETSPAVNRTPPPARIKTVPKVERSDSTARDKKKRKRTLSSGDGQATIKPGFLVVYTDPPGAKVFVDGKDTGRKTPVSASKRLRVAPGEHSVRVVLGERKATRKVTIESGKAKSVGFK